MNDGLNVSRWVVLLLCLGVVSLTSCDGKPTQDDARSPKRDRNNLVRQTACTAVEELLGDVAPYFGGQANDRPLTRSALQLAAATDELQAVDPEHSPEFQLAGIVAFAFRNNERADPAAPPNTDLGAVWSETMRIVTRTCREWGISVDLGTEY